MENSNYIKFLELLKELDDKSIALVTCLATGLLAKQELDKQDQTGKAC